MRRAVEGSRDRVLCHAASRRSPDGLSPKPHFPSPVFSKVLPARIDLLDQRNFLLPPPAFELLFAADRSLHLIIGFVIHEAMDFVLFGESRMESILCCDMRRSK